MLVRKFTELISQKTFGEMMSLEKSARKQHADVAIGKWLMGISAEDGDLSFESEHFSVSSILVFAHGGSSTSTLHLVTPFTPASLCADRLSTREAFPDLSHCPVLGQATIIKCFSKVAPKPTVRVSLRTQTL